MTVIGWAVVERGEVNIRTVSDTRRAAIVNWLVVDRRVLVTTAMADHQIERLWQDMAGLAECMTVEVRVATLGRA